MNYSEDQFLPSGAYSHDTPSANAIRNAIAALPTSGKSDKFECTKYTAPYLFSTENLVGTYNKVSPDGKKILTIAASGDHAFDAYLGGARHVDTFDFNLLQKCVLNLKTEIIHRMTYKEFRSFFRALHTGNLYASFNILSPYMPHLSPESQTFMNEFYHNPRVNPKYFFQGVPFYQPGMNDMRSPYWKNGIKYIQSADNFNQLKKRLPDKINFTLADVQTMANTINEDYDIIHLSNIIDYVPDLETHTGTKKFCDDTLQKLFNRLTPGGKMILLYSWGDDPAPIIDKLSPRQKVCIKNLISRYGDPTAIQIPSVQQRYDNDALWIFQNTR